MPFFKIFIGCFLLLSTVNKGVAQEAAPPQYFAYIFLSEGCPMCQGYAATLNQLAENYKPKGVQFVGVFPNFYVTDSAILDFKKQYDIRFSLQRDGDFKLTNQFKATTTPQVFLTDKNDKIIYNGMIDNAYFQRGKRRGITSDFYLKNALENALLGQNVVVAQTTAVGCVIVKD